MKPTAILWDYDGTLMDSVHKNFTVNKEIVRYLNPGIEPDNSPAALTSLDAYIEIVHKSSNWIEIYIEDFGLKPEQAIQAGKLWSEYHLTNKTPSNLFAGVSEIVKSFADIPQGICSLNCVNNINVMLQANNMDNYFSSVVGHNSIAIEKAKPHPDAFIHCLNEMGVTEEGTIFYIGDHQDDTRFAKNAEQVLKKKNKDIRVLSIAAAYSGAKPNSWDIKPDYTVNSVAEIKKIISDLSRLIK